MLVFPSMIRLNSFAYCEHFSSTELLVVAVAAVSLSHCSYWFVKPPDFSARPDLYSPSVL